MSRIPDQTLQQILAATDVVTLIGRYVKLRRAGSNWVGLCPFHTERTPSFNVYPHNSSYHCFGCGASGTAITFMMHQEGMQFVEATKRLAEAAGIKVEEEVWDANTEREAKERALLKKINAEIAAWYHELLLKHQMAHDARQYLKGRGINSAVAKNWLMGYAPPRGDMLRQWARGRGYSDQQLVHAGIMADTEGRGIIPRFRHRLMFPVRDQNGQVIAFSGRALEADAKAKYLNSAETPIFNKSQTLFGFDKSKKSIGKQGNAIVVEGQIDLIIAYENGFQNVIAALGTAFTEFHAKMLHRVCSEVILCYDADNAGFKAAERAYGKLSPEGIVVKVATLPQGEDPDSLIRQQGPEVFAQLIRSAADYLDFQIKHKRAALGSDLKNQVALIEQTAVSIAMNPSIAARDLMIRSHAMQLNVSEDALRKQVLSFVRRQQNAKNQSTTAATEAKETTPAEQAKRMLATQHPVALMLTQQALRDDDVLEWLRHLQLDEMLAGMPGCEMLFTVVRSTTRNVTAGGALAFLATLPAADEAAFVQLLARVMPAENPEHALQTLCKQRLSALIDKARQRIRNQQLEGADLLALHKQIEDWTAELAMI